MKKYAAFLIGMVTAGFILTGCGEKSEELVYADLTVEQNKAKIQEDGLVMVEKLNGMSDLSGVFALQDLMELMAYSTLTGDSVEVAVSQLIAPLLQLDKNVLALTKLRSSTIEIETISDLMAKAGGVYTYSKESESFNRVAGTTKLEFLFPIGSSMTNNGKLTIDNVTSETSTLVSTDLPKSVDMKLTKASDELLSLKFTAAYDADDVPTSWNTTLTCAEGYKFTQSMVNTETDASWQFAYTLNNDNLLSGKFSSKGDFSYDAMNNSEELDDKEWIDQVLDNANVYVQLGNLKMTGLVDVNKMMTAFDAAFPQGEADSEADVTKVCQLLNTHVTMLLLYAKEGTIIAKSSFYKSEYTSWEFNETTNQYTVVTGYEPSMQFLFKDGSAMDESFFTQGFDNLLTEFQEMMNSMQQNYAR